jgi:hypothetical protein
MGIAFGGWFFLTMVFGLVGFCYLVLAYLIEDSAVGLDHSVFDLVARGLFQLPFMGLAIVLAVLGIDIGAIPQAIVISWYATGVIFIGSFLLMRRSS